MLQSLTLQEVGSNVRRRLTVVFATTSVLSLLALPALGDPPDDADGLGYDLGLVTLHGPASMSCGQSVEPSHAQTFIESSALDPFAMPLSVDLQVPSHVPFDLETGLDVFVNMPPGCYKSRIKVDHIDEFTHRLTPILAQEGRECVPGSRFEHQVVSLGQLVPGRHEIFVENTMRPVERRFFRVHEADLSASNGGSRQ